MITRADIARAFGIPGDLLGQPSQEDNHSGEEAIPEMGTFKVTYTVMGEKPTTLPEGATVETLSPLPISLNTNGATLSVRARKNYGGRPTLAELKIEAGRGYEPRTYGLTRAEALELSKALTEAVDADEKAERERAATRSGAVTDFMRERVNPLYGLR